MAGKYTREEVSELIVNTLRGLHFRQDITEDSQYGIDIADDENLKRLCYYALRLHLEKIGGLVVNFRLEDCVRAKSVKDIVEAAWSDLKDDV